MPRHALLPLLFTAVSMLCSYQAAKLVQALVGSFPPRDLTTGFDLATAFVPWWSWVYLGSYLFWIYVYVIPARDSEKLACELAAADGVGKLMCLLFFLLLPTTNVRPELEGTGLSLFLMRLIYSFDTPTNLFPSIHCFIAWLGMRMIFRCEALRHKGLHCCVAVLGTVLVFLSTLYTKQHVAVDIPGAIAVAEIGILLARCTPLPSWIRGLSRAFLNSSLGQWLRPPVEEGA